MAFNGSGVFVRLYNWVNDASAGVKIRADRFDAEFNGIATGLSTCITKNGQTTVTANLPMSGYKHTNVGAASADSEYATYGQLNTATAFDNTESGLTAETLQGAIDELASEKLDAIFASQEEAEAGTAEDKPMNALRTAQAISAQVMQLVYPVGSFYISKTVSTNPNTLLGFGTWVAVSGKMLIGADGTYTAGSTGGSATTTQTSSTLYGHSHVQKTYSDGAGTYRNASGTASETAVSMGVATYSTGSSNAMTTISPYLAAYIWERTA